MKRPAVLLIVYFFFCVNCAYALDWKKLHERADRVDLSGAMASLEAGPDSIDHKYVIGLVFLNLHRDKQAGEVFAEILASDPDCTEAKWGAAEVLRRQHRLEKSEALLRQVLKAVPDFSPALITLAYIRYIQMDFNGAVRLAIKVLAQGEESVDRSNYVRARLIYAGTKGMIAHYGGPVSKVVNGTAIFPSLRAAERLQPDSAGVKFGLGSFYLLAPNLVGGDVKKAEVYLKKAIEIDPLFADAYVRLGQLYKIKGEDSKYLEYLKRAEEIDPGNELAMDISSGRCKFICPGKS